LVYWLARMNWIFGVTCSLVVGHSLSNLAFNLIKILHYSGRIANQTVVLSFAGLFFSQIWTISYHFSPNQILLLCTLCS